jgi:hypothetical protein
MKKYISSILLLSFTIVLLWSCDEKIELVSSTSSPSGLAYIKIGQYSPNFRTVFGNRDSINVYANGVKLNGNFLTYGSIFPSTSNLYAAVPAGTQALRITVNGVNTPDSITLATITKTLTAGNYYSFMLTDSALTTNESKQIFVQDNPVISDTSHITVRFIHAVLNDTLGKNVDVFSMRLNANIFSNVAPGTTTPFISEPYFFISDTLIVKRAGINFELARVTTVATPIQRQRAYTLIYKGNAANTTAPKGRSLSYFFNQ